MKKYFLCPDGEKTTIEDCLNGNCRVNNPCSPLTYRRVAARDRKWEGKPSVTQLINGTREEYLKLTKDYAISPDDSAFMIVGTKSHSNLEKSETKEDNLLTEESMEYQGIKGTADLMEQQENGECWLIDYKVVGAYTVRKLIGYVSTEVPILDENGKPVLLQRGKNAGKPKTEKVWEVNPDKADYSGYDLQLNMYRLMYESYGFKIDRLKIFAIVRDGGIMSAVKNGIDKKTYYIDIPIMPAEKVLEFFNFKKSELLNHLGKNILPAPCKAEECWNGNKCNPKYCNVYHHCVEHGDNIYVSGASFDNSDD